MEAGKLKHLIELQRSVETLTPSRKAVTTWTTYARGKAELRQAGINEFLRDGVEGTNRSGAFLIGWIAGVALSDRLICDGRTWNIVELQEVGNRQGLQIRVVAA